MTNTDKTILISGMMFNAVFFALMLAELVITKAAGIGLFVALATYVFFDQCYYKIKDWSLLPIANSPSVHKIIHTLKIHNYSEVVNYD